MKVLHLCPSFNNIIYANLCDQLIANNIKCDVFSFLVKGAKYKPVERNYCYHSTPFSNFDRYFFFFKEKKIINSLNNLINTEEYDIVHAHTLFVSGYIAFQLKKKNKIPYIVAVRSSDVDTFFKLRFYLRSIGKNILKEASKIIFISPAIKKRLFENYLSPSEQKNLESKCVILPNGIDDFWFSNGLTNVKKPNHTFIYYGDIDTNKNIITSCEALESFKKVYDDTKFYVIGPVKEKSVFDEIIKFNFVEYIEKLPKEKLLEYLRLSSIFLMPSRSETFGLSYIESMTQGLPIIYSKNQGPDGYFNNCVGFAVSPNSSKDELSRINDIFSNYELISKNALEESKPFKWEIVARKYSDIYLEVLNEPIK